MTIKLKILAGSTVDDCQSVDYKGGEPVPVDNAHFKGHARVLLKDKDNLHPYFNDHSNKGVTWSIQLSGVIQDDDVNGDDLVFGNRFDEPIRDSLPWGTGMAVKFIKYLDPTLTEDLQSDTPWAFSPVCSTVERLRISDNAGDDDDSNDALVIDDDVSCLFSDSDSNHPERGHAKERRKWFHDEEHRRDAELSKKKVAFDFAKGFIDFSTLSLSFPEISLNIGLLKHWDGQPVRFYLRNRKTGQDYAVVQFIIEDVGADAPEKTKQVAAEHDLGTEH
ncbi:hypothetical protein E3P99_03673 [Wallemia hederae]|uniref:Domain of unknown function at the cortex 1 domain-containing protein n=1 Tax=Wallemia hederae TaxID=1540922 RepID=A0A4T0FF62_9BASI|nr:hypothetical protein E3P99_03673 [Wallemia hederae]